MPAKTREADDKNTKVVVSNRKAFHNFIIEEALEAGMALTGTEIKSIRAGRVNLGDAYVKPENGDLWLLNAHIARYEAGSYMSHEPLRPRRILMHRKQINLLTSKVQEKGLTLVPLKIYLKHSLAKVEIGLARGKKLYDKRETLRRRATDRDVDRELKG
jgi:SsrA-binding protein